MRVYFSCLLFLLSLFFFKKAQSQEDKPSEEFKKEMYFVKGEQCPNIQFKKIINYTKADASLNDFQGKLIILHLWVTSCGPCISVFPKLDSLQRKFNSQIQILLVGYEDESRVRRLFEKMKLLNKNYVLPNVIIDSLMFRKFLNSDGTIGGDIWIDKNGIVLGRTRGTDEHQLTSFFQHNDFDLFIHENPVLKKIHAEQFIPLLGTENGKMGEVKYHSVVTGYKNTLNNSCLVKVPANANENSIIRITNSSLFELCLLAYGRTEFFKEMDNSKYFYIKRYPAYLTDFRFKNQFFDQLDDLKYNNGFCYELIMPAKEPKMLLKAMQEDLKRYFNLKIDIKRKLADCLTLVSINKKHAKSKGGNPVFEKDNYGIKLVNQPVSKLIEALEYYLVTPEKPTIIDNTKINSTIDLELIVDLEEDIKVVRKILQKNGFDIVVRKQLINILSISPINVNLY
jgi:thiol-disulfide isomerase/thioredoxin